MSKVAPSGAVGNQHHKAIRTDAERFKLLQNIRQTAKPMAVKLQLKKELMAAPVKKTDGIKNIKFENKKRKKKFSDAWKTFKYTFEPFGSAIRSIEGHHGAGVVSYFVFLRYLLLVNFVVFLLSMFIWVPVIVTSSAAYVTSSTADTCSKLYSVVVSSDVFTLVLDFLQGSGWMEKTMLFYGYYGGNGLEGTSYNFSLAYILVCVFSLVVSLILMGKHLASGVSESILDVDEEFLKFWNMTYGSWDYSLSDEKSATIKQKSIRNDLVGAINDEAFLKKRDKRMRHCGKKCCIYFLRIIVNICIIILLGACAYAIYWVTEYSSEYVTENPDPQGTVNVVKKLAIQFLPSVTLTVLNVIVPIFFQKVVTLEQYTSDYVLKITLVRTVFLRLSSLVVLLVTLYLQVSCSRDSCGSITSPCNDITCWETYVGQQLYKLIVTDFLVLFIKTFLVELPRRLLYEKCGCGLMKLVGPPVFDIPANVLDLVYSQCLYWLALTFAPLTPGISVFKALVTFAVKMLSALKACAPAAHSANTSRTNTFFMVILLIAFFLCSFPVAYTLYRIEPSHGCGPFRTQAYMYEAITRTVAEWPAAGRDTYTVVTSAAFTGPLLLAFIMLTCFFSSISRAHKKVSGIFKEQIVGRDKEIKTLKVSSPSFKRKQKTSPPAPAPAPAPALPPGYDV